jgi:hypothetical protein
MFSTCVTYRKWKTSNARLGGDATPQRQTAPAAVTRTGLAFRALISDGVERLELVRA